MCSMPTLVTVLCLVALAFPSNLNATDGPGELNVSQLASAVKTAVAPLTNSKMNRVNTLKAFTNGIVGEITKIPERLEESCDILKEVVFNLRKGSSSHYGNATNIVTSFKKMVGQMVEARQCPSNLFSLNSNYNLNTLWDIPADTPKVETINANETPSENREYVSIDNRLILNLFTPTDEGDLRQAAAKAGTDGFVNMNTLLVAFQLIADKVEGEANDYTAAKLAEFQKASTSITEAMQHAAVIDNTVNQMSNMVNSHDVDMMVAMNSGVQAVNKGMNNVQCA